MTSFVASFELGYVYINIAENSFYRLYCAARDAGKVFLTGASGLVAPFAASHGIRQNCPSSPLLFCMLLSGVEHRVLRETPGVSVLLGDLAWSLALRGMVSYASDIKLLASTPADLCW